ncbi:MAG: phospholipid carrier-dependent glycosyltransferase [Pseudonocardiales bacterium]|nr:phospholipid carrier-dependent glycosyltransferase [Pseudonocardiales bacterium]
MPIRPLAPEKTFADAPTAPIAVAPRALARRVSSPSGVTRVALLSAIIIGSMAFAVRSIGLSRSFELWVDEMLYAELGRSVSRGEFPTLPDGPFFLHPPGFFLVEGAVIKIFGISGDSMSVVYDLRWLSAALGAISVALAFLLVRRVAGTRIAWFSAIVLVFEPFVLRNNSRVFLETMAGAAVLAGLLILVSYLGREQRKPAWAPLLVAGLFLGYGWLTKDVFAIYAMVPVVLATFWRHTLRPREAAIVLGGVVTPYAAYLIVLASKGRLSDWWYAKTSGLQRILGAVQSTGFNAPNGPSLTSRLLAQVGEYGTSYVLLLACPVAGALACRSRRPERRLIGLTAVAMGVFGVYIALFGTFEEQYGYGIMIASVTALTICAAEVCERRHALAWTVVWVGSAFLVLTVALGTRVELTRDNGFQQFRAWVVTNLPANAHVGVTDSTAEWAFQNDPRFGAWPTARSLEEHDAHYILTQSLPASQGYDYESRQMLDWLTRHATPVFHDAGPTNGNTVLWFIDQPTLKLAAQLNVGSPLPETDGRG